MNGEMKVAMVGELPNLYAQRDELLLGDVCGALHEGLAGVVDAVLLEAEAVAPREGVLSRALVGRIVDDVLEIVAYEFEEFLEDDGCFLLV